MSLGGILHVPAGAETGGLGANRDGRSDPF